MRKLLYYIYIGLGTIAICAIVIIDMIIGIYTPIPSFEKFCSGLLFMVVLIPTVEIGKELIKKLIKWFKK